METLDLASYGVQEMSIEELSEIQGGSIGGVIRWVLKRLGGSIIGDYAKEFAGDIYESHTKTLSNLGVDACNAAMMFN